MDTFLLSHQLRVTMIPIAKAILKSMELITLISKDA